MQKLPRKFVERASRSLRGYQAITESHRVRDVSEADTVTVVKDMLAEIFGFDKYTELTSEQQIRGTYCDLAIRIDGKVRFIVEVKSAGLSLTDAHLRQSLNYGANQGIEWIVLTNSIDWRLYKVIFGQPINFEEVTAFNIHDMSASREDDLQLMFLLAREGIATDAISSFHQRSQILNKFTVAQIAFSEPAVTAIRRELRRLFPELRVAPEHLTEILFNQVMKREVLEGDKVKEAQNRIRKAAARASRLSASKPAGEVTEEMLQPPAPDGEMVAGSGSGAPDQAL